MAKKTAVTIPTRQTSGKTEMENILFGQLRQGAGKQNFAIRDQKKYESDKVQGLARSIASEGLKVPFVATKTEENVTINGNELSVHTIVDGHRRFFAILWLINASTDQFSELTEVPVQVISGASDADLYVTTFSLNSEREDFSDAEILTIVAGCKIRKIDDSRAMNNLSVSETQFKRYKLIAECDWMCQAVKNDEIKMTLAAKILEAAKKVKRIDECEMPFKDWVKQTEREIERQKAAYEKAKKKIPESKSFVKNYLNTEILTGWIKVIESTDEIVFTDDEGEFSFGFLMDDGKLSFPKLEFDCAKRSSADLKKLGAEVTRLRTIITGEFAKKRKIEMITDLSEKELDDAAAELDAVVQKTEKEEKGRTPATKLHEPASTAADRDLAKEVEEELDEEVNEEVDEDADEDADEESDEE